jgi:hypothetical protein
MHAVTTRSIAAQQRFVHKVGERRERGLCHERGSLVPEATVKDGELLNNRPFLIVKQVPGMCERCTYAAMACWDIAERGGKEIEVSFYFLSDLFVAVSTYPGGS